MVATFKSILAFLILWVGIMAVNGLSAQEIRVFNRGDFDLRGPVKSCLVSTSYGKEEYDFNKEGLLVKAVTRYNELDYDITHYKLKEGELQEKRVENYRDGKFVKNTSIANLYQRDTMQGLKITERILSYNSEFLDQYEYSYDTIGRPVMIWRTNNMGRDKTTISYEEEEGDTIATYYLNDVIQKSVTTFVDRDDPAQKKNYTQEFMEGELQFSQEKTFNQVGKLLSEVRFRYDSIAQSFHPIESIYYTYNSEGSLSSQKTVNDRYTDSKEYIYQYDGEGGNWIKQIITPDNNYITRKIKYYNPATVEGKLPE